MGHLLNFPTFGPPSESEAKSGLGNHGEAVMVEWKKESASAGSKEARLIYAAHLPKTQYNVGRVLTLPADENVLYIEEWVANLLPFDRPAHWVQHVTFGPPFVEPGKTVLDVSATKGEVRGGSEGTLRPGMVEWPWGTSHDGRKVSLREMQTRERSGAYYALLMDPSRETSYMTMYHKDFRLLVGYIWKTRDFPWIGDWQENKGNQGSAVAGQGHCAGHGIWNDAVHRADETFGGGRLAVRSSTLPLDWRGGTGEGSLPGLRHRDCRWLPRCGGCRRAGGPKSSSRKEKPARRSCSGAEEAAGDPGKRGTKRPCADDAGGSLSGRDCLGGVWGGCRGSAGPQADGLGL